MKPTNRKWNQKGFSLVELILTITLMTIGLPAIMHLFAETIMTSAKLVVQPTSADLANELMEEIKSRKFDERTAKTNGNWSTIMGTDSGETTKAQFDDVDDFNGYTQSFSGYTGYSATVSVGYVSSANINSLLTIPGTVPASWTPSYKMITVTISNAALPANYVLKTLVTEVQSL
ncbi:MAG: prepilin-type N-terminal cleavage/methylation domain-containing protein [Deltaproteobacteria bacterium]|nr:MAG: prepilin-type N-terminal cleavage/methylation domain-containing protein [Deltaproteobacteria bacterium]